MNSSITLRSHPIPSAAPQISKPLSYIYILNDHSAGQCAEHWNSAMNQTAPLCSGVTWASTADQQVKIPLQQDTIRAGTEVCTGHDGSSEKASSHLGPRKVSRKMITELRLTGKGGGGGRSDKGNGGEKRTFQAQGTA